MNEATRPLTNKEYYQELPPHVLLPSHEELKPITEETNTFSECSFRSEFELLSFQSKLQVATDLVRQSILPDYYADPKTEQETLRGDCFTSSHLLIRYLKYLNVGTSHTQVMVGRRPFDPMDKKSGKHSIVIVEDEQGGKWQADATPWMGYGYGSVRSEADSELIAESYTTITEEDVICINLIKELRHLSIVDKERVEQDILLYQNILEDATKKPHLRGFSAEGYAALCRSTTNIALKEVFATKVIDLDPLKGLGPDILEYASNTEGHTQARKGLSHAVEEQISVWETELNDLISHPSKDTCHRQLELAQWIANEKAFIGQLNIPTVKIDNAFIPMTRIGARFIKEHDLTTAIIKSSAEYLGVKASIKEVLRQYPIVSEISYNPTSPTQISGIKPVLFSHSLADTHERSTSGPTTAMLIQASPQILSEIKKNIRSTLGSRLIGQRVLWRDGEYIDWHPFTMNLLHTADHASESAMHFLMAFPEFSTINRWTYPNPKL